MNLRHFHLLVKEVPPDGAYSAHGPGFLGAVKQTPSVWILWNLKLMLGGGWEEVLELVLLGLRLDMDLIQLEAGRKMVIVLVKEFHIVGVKRKSNF